MNSYDGLENTAYCRHREIQKSDEVLEWRLGLLDSASHFVDRQVTWTGELISGLWDQIEDDGEETVGTNIAKKANEHSCI